MNTTTKILLVPVFAVLITVLGVGAAVASEVGGTIGLGGGSNNSQGNYTDGGLAGSVSEGSASDSSSGSSAATDSGRTGGRSGTRGNGGAPQGSGEDVIVILDDGSAAPAGSGFAGTGGGYDPRLEATIAAENGGDNTITPGEAVAFNNANNPLLNTDLVAASGESGVGSAKVWTAIVLGLALLGLAGYAVNALIAYRRENDL